MAELNEVIHQAVRLRIMAALATLSPDDEVEFTYLRDLLEVTDGNLGAHLRKLEEVDYITLNKQFVDRKPRTFVSATKKGRRVFEEHVEALETILKGNEARK
jgi:DNA-binding MarR family transcriptional regulator